MWRMCNLTRNIPFWPLLITEDQLDRIEAKLDLMALARVLFPAPTPSSQNDATDVKNLLESFLEKLTGGTSGEDARAHHLNCARILIDYSL